MEELHVITVFLWQERLILSVLIFFFKWPQLAELKLISQLYYKISPKTAKYKLDEYFYFEIA